MAEIAAICIHVENFVQDFGLQNLYDHLDNIYNLLTEDLRPAALLLLVSIGVNGYIWRRDVFYVKVVCWKPSH